MEKAFSKRLNPVTKSRVLMLVAALALACVSAAAQHEGHDMHGHAPQTSATPDKSKAQAQGATHAPAESQHDHSQHEQQGTTAQPDKPKDTQPGANQTPAPTPTLTPAPSPTPAATGQDAHTGQHEMTGGETSKPDDRMGEMNHTSGGMDHSAHGGQMAGMEDSAGGEDTGLMVMAGDSMSVRVGGSRTNLMSMGRMGSGTAWQPASSPMYMWHRSTGDWLLMLHGEAKLGVNRQGGPRGVTKFESQNWLMPMAFRKLGRGTLQLRGMFSLEPLTYSGAGSPQLFQAGESYRGRPLVDFQHPHDLFMELSATYTVPVGERGTWYAYLGFPGEPALGPVAFMHRASASENPSAPLAHHLQDSTHISYGVFTTGFTYRWLKAEGSIFNGREPDERRYNFEFNPWNSRSLRVTVAPNDNWAVQYSYGLLRNPEVLEAGDTRRQTASVQYGRPLTRGNLAAALIWGRNRNEHAGVESHLNGYTAEATVNFLDKNYAYTRLELVDREELLGHDELHRLGFGEDARPQFRVGAYTFGAARDVWQTNDWSIALGGDLTLYSKPEALDALYGRDPKSYKFFIRIRPARMKQEGHGAHAGHGDD
jgi:hypothetical protein